MKKVIFILMLFITTIVVVQPTYAQYSENINLRQDYVLWDFGLSSKVQTLYNTNGESTSFDLTGTQSYYYNFASMFDEIIYLLNYGGTESLYFGNNVFKHEKLNSNEYRYEVNFYIDNPLIFDLAYNVGFGWDYTGYNAIGITKFVYTISFIYNDGIGLITQVDHYFNGYGPNHTLIKSSGAFGSASTQVAIAIRNDTTFLNDVYNNGYKAGEIDGLAQGFLNGVLYSFQNGFQGYYDNTSSYTYLLGYNEGYNLGIVTNLDVKSLFEQVLDGISGIFTMTIMPGFTVGSFIMIPIAFGLFKWFMKIFGGK